MNDITRTVERLRAAFQERKNMPTQPPWYLDQEHHEEGYGILGGEDEQLAVFRRLPDAQFALRAVNAHDDLVAALEQAHGGIAPYFTKDGTEHGSVENIKGGEVVQQIRAALAKAKGEA